MNNVREFYSTYSPCIYSIFLKAESEEFRCSECVYDFTIGQKICHTIAFVIAVFRSKRDIHTIVKAFTLN